MDERSEGTRHVYYIDPKGLAPCGAGLTGSGTMLSKRSKPKWKRNRQEKMSVHEIAPAPVRKTIHVNASQARAFEVFTARFAAWWPKSITLRKWTCRTCDRAAPGRPLV